MPRFTPARISGDHLLRSAPGEDRSQQPASSLGALSFSTKQPSCPRSRALGTRQRAPSLGGTAFPTARRCRRRVAACAGARGADHLASGGKAPGRWAYRVIQTGKVSGGRRFLPRDREPSPAADHADGFAPVSGRVRNGGCRGHHPPSPARGAPGRESGGTDPPDPLSDFDGSVLQFPLPDEFSARGSDVATPHGE
jgi:hypothetical protein